MNLSKQQLQLLNSTSFFEEKRAVLKAVEINLSIICDNLKQSYSEEAKTISFAPQKTASKITRGENLKGLPYLLLDFPQQFSKTEIFSFRLLFWWGKGFTLFLHLKNNQLSAIQQHLHQNRAALRDDNFYLSITGDEWEHDYTAKNYEKLSEFTPKESINFIKFAYPISFDQSADLKTIVLKKVTNLFALLAKYETI